MQRIVSCAYSSTLPLSQKLRPLKSRVITTHHTSSLLSNKHGGPRSVRGSPGRVSARSRVSDGVFRDWFGCTVSGCLSDCRRRAVVAVVAEAAAAGRGHGAAGVRVGVGGRRSQSSDAVSRLVPQQTRISRHLCWVFR